MRLKKKSTRAEFLEICLDLKYVLHYRKCFDFFARLAIIEFSEKRVEYIGLYFANILHPIKSRGQQTFCKGLDGKISCILMSV